MCFGGGSVPKPPKPAPIPKKEDPEVQLAIENERRFAAQRSGASKTNVTGGLGITTAATTAKKTLLGS